jgi:phosphoribosylanthranilate isomerase
MIKGCKICGISDLHTLNYIVNHPYPPQLIGFVCNYKKSPRYVDINKLKELVNIDKKDSKFVAVLVKPDNEILESIKNLPFDYYQIYNSSPKEIKSIKNKFKKKIITGLTIQNIEDVKKYKLYREVTDIYLFDSKGYEKSMSFNHSLLQNIKFNKEIMIAGNIKFDDNVDKFKKICNYIDISGGLESSGSKDISKIDIFLNKVKKLNNEN